MSRHDVPAADLTTLAVGGPIATVVDVASEEELLTALAENPRALCIGGGSNLLVSDDGYDGAIIHAHASVPAVSTDGSIVHVEATTDWDALVSYTIANNLQGLEATSGVPGSTGGAVVQNLGAYGQEIADVVVSVSAWDTQQRKLVRFTKDECEFSYRTSRFKHDTQRRYVVTSADLLLQHTEVAIPRYGDVSRALHEEFGTEGPYPLSAIRKTVLDVRRSKGMLLGASLPSAGSFFTNPILNASQAAALKEQGFTVNERSDGKMLTSAAALIQKAGYKRGFRLGNAGLSEFHVLALVNASNATATDIITLARKIREDVMQRFDVLLTPEPVLLGFETNPFD